MKTFVTVLSSISISSADNDSTNCFDKPSSASVPAANGNDNTGGNDNAGTGNNDGKADNCDKTVVQIKNFSDKRNDILIVDKLESEQEGNTSSSTSTAAPRNSTSWPTRRTSRGAANKDDKSPWPYIKEYFCYLSKTPSEKSANFQCMLCKPKNKKLSTRVTSVNNFNKHIGRAHPTHVKKFQVCINSSKRGKKRK